MQASEARNVVRDLEFGFQKEIQDFSKSEAFTSGIPQSFAEQLSQMQNRMKGAMAKFEKDCLDVERLQKTKQYDAMILAVTRYRIMKNACITQLEELKISIRQPQTVSVS